MCHFVLKVTLLRMVKLIKCGKMMFSKTTGVSPLYGCITPFFYHKVGCVLKSCL